MEEMKKLNLNKYFPQSGQLFDPVAYGKMRADTFNQTPGNLTGIDCKKCLNRGTIAFPTDEGDVVVRECSCMKTRKSIWKMEQSGLKNVVKEMTFEKFKVTEEWQALIKKGAMEYADSLDGWLLFCGQSGGGKSHLCTAVCRQRLLNGDEVRYMPWRDDIADLKSLSRDNENREKKIKELKTVQILYIDDLFKTGKSADGSSNPTGADINIAFEIINYRDNNDLTTIVSTEKTPLELLEIDEATASRIIKRAKGHTFEIGRQESRNYRLRDVVTV